jgi:hypothetical protein
MTASRIRSERNGYPLRRSQGMILVGYAERNIRLRCQRFDALHFAKPRTVRVRLSRTR